MSPRSVVAGKRRFTMLSPGLVRMEFSPTGKFEDRRSLTAYAKRQPRAFKKVTRKKGELVLETGQLTLVSREPDRAFFPANLEVRWRQDGLLQYWRAGDRDHRNLGGTVHSLDRYARDSVLAGVHPADGSPVNSQGNVWTAWLQCEDDPWYYEQSSGDDAGKGERILARTRNAALDGGKYSPGVLSRSGYFLVNDSETPLLDDDDFPVERNQPGYQDWYFLCCGADYKAGLAELLRLTGRAPLPTKNAFGLIFSRWPACDEQEARDIIARFKAEGIPLSTLVLDMEWHREGWANWDWDPEMYANPGAFFNWIHGQGMEITLNVHPLHVRHDDSHFKAYVDAVGGKKRVETATYQDKKLRKIKVNICDKREADAFMSICHDEFVRLGLDYWWVDGSRGTLNGADDQLVTSKVYFENVETRRQRGMLLSRYGGLGSHRYGVFFTGDTQSAWEVLRWQCEFNIRAGHLGLAYTSHDIGGFFGANAPLMDPELYARWVQFGAFNPVFRLHSAPGSGSRQPWDYGDHYGKTAIKHMRLRNSLLPYIYSAARQHYDSGVPIVRGLFLEHPANEQAYRFDQYYFGDALVVAPVLEPRDRRRVYLPAGAWYRFETSTVVEGGAEFETKVGAGSIPVFAKAGSIVVRQPANVAPGASHIDELILDVYPGANGGATLYEDDGKSHGYKRGRCCCTRVELRDDGKVVILTAAKPEGRPFGETRRITVNLAVAKRPRGVRLGTKRLPASACTQREDGRYQIDLPEMPSANRYVLTLTR